MPQAINRPKVVITRPKQYQEETAEKLLELGFEPIKAPLSEIIFKPPNSWNILGYDYYIITSKNAFKAISGYRELDKAKFLVVGEATKNLGKRLGFENIVASFDNLSELENYIYQNSSNFNNHSGYRNSYLYLSGEEITREIEFADRIIVYKNKFYNNLSLTSLFDVVNLHIDDLLFYSYNTAKIFANKCVEEEVTKLLQNCNFFAISKEVAELLNKNFNNVFYPNKPNSKELLRLLNERGK
jgi:uroporphyrinogen-III synthase